MEDVWEFGKGEEKEQKLNKEEFSLWFGLV